MDEGETAADDPGAPRRAGNGLWGAMTGSATPSSRTRRAQEAERLLAECQTPAAAYLYPVAAVPEAEMQGNQGANEKR